MLPTRSAIDSRTVVKTASIVGAGIGGIATAIRLQAKGYQVSVFESSNELGGKLRDFMLDGFRFDAGPSLFTLPDLVDELFRIAQKNPKDYFHYEQLDRSCHYFWDDGTALVAWSDRKAFKAEVKEQLGADELALEKKLQHSAFQYDTLAELFMHKSLHKWRSFANWATLRALFRIPFLGLSTSMHKANKKLNNDKLTQLFNRYATYNGSNPYDAPAVLNMIPHLEHGIGTFFPKNGMVDIRNALIRLAEELGVNFHLNSKVDRIVHENGSATGIDIQGQFYPSILVVSNADIHPTYHHLLKDLKLPVKQLAQERSSSALIFYWGIDASFEQLHLHNIMFSNSYKEEFDALFKHKTLIDDPTVYINITSKCKQDDAPSGAENWFVMINAPSREGGLSAEEINLAKANIIKKIEGVLKTDLASKIVCEEILTPSLIQSKTSSYLGALYGTSSNDPMSAFLRHPNFSKNLKNLYFTGGSVHPGGGIPLCLLSAKIIDEMLDHA